MGEDVDMSMETMDVDTSDVGGTADFGDLGDTVADVPEDVPEDDSSDASDMTDESVNNIADDFSEDISEDIPEDDPIGTDDGEALSEDVSDELPEDTENAGDAYDELPEDTEDAGEPLTEEADDLSPTELSEDTTDGSVDTEDEADSMPEEIPEDAEEVSSEEADEQSYDAAEETPDELEEQSEMVEEQPEEVEGQPEAVEEQPETLEEQPETLDEQPEMVDSSHSNAETYQYETAPETQDAKNPEQSGEFAYADNEYRDRWQDFAAEFSDGTSDAQKWDSMGDVPFSGVNESGDMPEEQPEMQEEQLETLDEQPETPEEQPETPDEQPEAVEEQPEAVEEQPETLDEQPEAPEEQKDEFDRVLDRVMDSDLSPEHKKQILEDMKAEMLAQQGDPETGDYSEESAEYSDEDDTDEGPVLTLKRDDQELLDAGARDIERVLEAKEFDYMDKGLEEDEIAQRLEEDRQELEQQFLQDAFPERDIQFNHEHQPIRDNEDISKISDVKNWLGDINPKFDEFDPESPYCNNCGSCAYAVYQRLEGKTDSCASAENIGYNSEMEALTGMEQVSMSPDEIQRRLLEQGDGAHAIIGIDRAEGPGHWFNAACIDGKVVAIDGQTGEIMDWPPDYGDVVNWEMSMKKEDK